jgi:hypothetical protein
MSLELMGISLLSKDGPWIMDINLITQQDRQTSGHWAFVSSLDWLQQGLMGTFMTIISRELSPGT